MNDTYRYHSKDDVLRRPRKKYGLSHSLCRALQQRQPMGSQPHQPPSPLDHQEVDMPCQGHTRIRQAIQPATGTQRALSPSGFRSKLARPDPYALGVPGRLRSNYLIRVETRASDVDQFVVSSTSLSGSTSTMMMFSMAFSSHPSSLTSCASSMTVESNMRIQDGYLESTGIERTFVDGD